MAHSSTPGATAHGRVPTVVIVGGGASGTLTVVHLLRRLEAVQAAARIVLVDKHGRHGAGQAYSTTDPRHLLNACADKMSAFPDDPGHLPAWARANGLDVSGSDFLSRAVYGRYLRDVLDAAERRAWPAVRVARLTAAVSAVGRPDPGGRVRVRLSDGRDIDADAVVLATGNSAPSALPRPAEAAGRYVADPWAPGALARIGDGSPVLVVGTGLTMVDISLTVTRAHPDAVVHAISRHGMLPRGHRCPPSPPAWMPVADDVTGLSRLLRAVRAAIDEHDGDWRSVVDGLRPHVPRIWSRLSAPDRRRFLGLAARYWEVHRHRIPPETATRIGELRAAGRLTVLPGTLVRATATDDALIAQVADGSGSTRDLRVGWLVNGTGPSSDVTRDPFLATLFAAGVARPDELRMGLDADDDGMVLDADGRPNDKIFTLGPPLRGKRYETTAVPEIRAQAVALAPRIAEAIGVRVRTAPQARLPTLHWRSGIPSQA
ncbi:hypothetical protein Pth03_71670 [Planotetraspora thailandica]|uniref:FAD-dependent urate hydroxylase HpyO/Asp monooxygenase CreE-like FAD/NAD(P)-binding domain-containing protein n=1 Tax=Planotetraspora thailandica TaxID=487172 RepID=A0A8J3Y0U8_9ACTN|nr:FAD/NAD(P)-binding protein [Planotetraspora thailandica]GII58778.1 hypothetical protein Pth03_71670 [Planotetraspora thailandica]